VTSQKAACHVHAQRFQFICYANSLPLVKCSCFRENTISLKYHLTSPSCHPTFEPFEIETDKLRLPMKDGLLDWDCVEALSISDIVKSLKYIHENGIFPVSQRPLSHRSSHGIPHRISKPLLTSSQPDLDSKEDQNSVGTCPVPDEKIEDLKARVKAWMEPGNPGHGILNAPADPVKLYVFDGFLLYSRSMSSVQPQMDIKMFLRVSYAKAKARREARSGYVTLEGFWEDPPGYVDKIVWPNYVEDHKWMFEDENVEGKLKEDALQDWNIKCPGDGLDVDMTIVLEWAVDLLMEQLPILAKRT
jgi:nicotinamide/nicotinate riboside kinase